MFIVLGCKTRVLFQALAGLGSLFMKERPVWPDVGYKRNTNFTIYAQKVTRYNSFFIKSDILPRGQNSCKVFWLILKQNLLPKTFENAQSDHNDLDSYAYVRFPILGRSIYLLPWMFLGWFTLDAAVCVFRSGLHQCRDRKFSISLRKRNRLLQTHPKTQ